MALKKKITKEEHAKLSDVLKAEYKLDGEDYILDVDGDEDIGALKRAKDRESQENKELKQKLKEADEKLQTISGDAARKSGDIATLEKAWQSKKEEEINALKTTFDTEKQTYQQKIDKLTNHTKKQLVDNVAISLAQRLSKSAPKILLPHIKDRIVADFDGDEPVTRILGPDGKVSKMTIDDLQNEFIANKDFASIITANSATGSAGSNQQRPPAGGFRGSENQVMDLSKVNPRDLAAHITESKANANNQS